MKKIIIVLVCCVALSGCITPSVTQYTGEIYPSNATFNNPNFKYIKTIKGVSEATYNNGWDEKKTEGLVNEAKQNEEEDKQKRELIDLHNQAEQLVYQTESNIKEFDKKLSDEDKKSLNDALENLKKANANSTKSDIQSAIDSLNNVWSGLANKLYDETNPPNENSDKDVNKDKTKKGVKEESEIEDADFEVVD